MHKKHGDDRIVTEERISHQQRGERVRAKYSPLKHERKAAVIVDLDGTLSLMNGRSPFDYKAAITDIPNIAVTKLVNQLFTSYRIIFVSGRGEEAEAETREWINNHMYFRVYDLYMRPAGDITTPNTELKKQVYLEKIKPHWFVEFILEDSAPVVKMWRELGLPCFQVYDCDH